jgi:hypothetical protein
MVEIPTGQPLPKLRKPGFDQRGATQNASHNLHQVDHFVWIVRQLLRSDGCTIDKVDALLAEASIAIANTQESIDRIKRRL